MIYPGSRHLFRSGLSLLLSSLRLIAVRACIRLKGPLLSLHLTPNHAKLSRSTLAAASLLCKACLLLWRDHSLEVLYFMTLQANSYSIKLS